MSPTNLRLPSVCQALLIAMISVVIALLLGTATPMMRNLFEPRVNTTGFTKPSIARSNGGGATCVTGNVSVTVAAMNTILLISPPENAFATTELSIKMLEPNGTIMQTAVGSTTQVTGTYQIFSKLCFPLTGTASSSTVQFLTHGATLDHNYWDITPNYSYADVAAQAGYATFSYDRLGTGLSEHPDPIQVVQSQIQVQIAHALINLLRTRSFSGFTFKHVVGVGHSAGSAISQGVTTQFPEDFDAVILTGSLASLTSLNTATASFDVIPASLDPAGRFPGLSSGYQLQGPIPQAVRTAFYRYHFFDPQSKLAASVHISLPLVPIY